MTPSPPRPPATSRVVRRILPFIARYPGRVAALALLTVLAAGLELIPALCTRIAVDDVLLVLGDRATSASAREGAVATLGLLVAGLLVVQIAASLSATFRGSLVAKLGARVAADLRAQVHAATQRVQLAFFDRDHSARQFARLGPDTERIRDLLVEGVQQLASNVLFLTGVVVVLAALDLRLALYVVSPLILMGIIGYAFGGRLAEAYRVHWRRLAVLNAFFSDAVGGAADTRAFSQEGSEARRFSERNERLADAASEAERVTSTYYAVAALPMGLGIVLVWLGGGARLLDGSLTLGTLLMFMAFQAASFRPVLALSRQVARLQGAVTSAERVFDLLDAEPEPHQATAPQNVRITGAVEFEDVSFAYEPDTPLLAGVSLSVAPGEIIGLKGRSGVGKSTLVKLLLRFHEVDGGRILIDGRDIRERSTRSLREAMGVVLQDAFMFGRSISENIAFGKEGASPEEILAAARAAHAHAFIASKPDAYDTQVGERGRLLSSGQRQRIAMARVFLRNPAIVVFDESTAFLRSAEDRSVQAEMEGLIAGRTAFLISNDDDCLKAAHRVFELVDGRLVERPRRVRARTAEPPPRSLDGDGEGQLLRPSSVQLHTERGREVAVVWAGGQARIGVGARALWPHTEPEAFVSIWDWTGTEIGVVPHLDEVEPRLRSWLHAAMARGRVVARIEQVHTVERLADGFAWSVTTGQGIERIETGGMSPEQADAPPGPRLIADLSGRRFELPSPDELDQRSRALLGWAS